MRLWSDEFTPMLLGEVSKPFDDNKYLFEIKYDGIRSLLFISKDQVIVKNRYGVDITDMFPELKNLNKYIKGNVIFDGEIIMFDDGKVSFSKLQKRIHLKNKNTIRYLSKTNPVLFVAFDILYENKDLIDLKLINRKKILERYENTDVFVKCKYVMKKGKQLFDVIKKMNMEGIVAKEVDGKYEIGVRSNTWLKIKNYHVSEFVIIGYIVKNDSHVISLLLGKYVSGKTKYAGKVSVSLKKNVARDVVDAEKIDPVWDLKIKNAVYIKPTIKCQVGFLEVTKHGKLRHPFLV